MANNPKLKIPDSKFTRLAFLGCGFATRLHSKTLRGFDNIERFYASRSPDRAEEYRRKYEGAGAFGSYEAALADESIDIALVATPPSTHLDLVLAALEAGKHVIVEKPPFLRSSDFTEVRAAAERFNRRVFVAENYFYKPILEKLREAISAGTIGEVKIISINALKEQETGDWRDESSLAGGGALYEGGIHWISFMANLGLPISGVHGFRPGGPQEMEKSMLVVFNYGQGAIGTLYYSWEIGSPLKGLRLSTIYGTDGAITFETNGLFLGIRGKKKRLTVPNPRDLLGYKAMFEDFFTSLDGGREPRFTLDMARRDLALVESVYDSLPKGDRK